MKKLLTLLLALAVFILPLSAGAEAVQTTAFMLSDPVISVSGNPLYDLTGFGYQLFGGADENGFQAIMNILANGNAAGDAVIYVDGDKIAFHLSGMQSAYGVTMEYIMQYIESELGVSFSDMGEWAGMLEGWDLGDKLTEAITAYVNENAQVSGPVDMEITLPSGTVTASVMTATIDGNGLLAAIADVLDGDAIAAAMLPYLQEYGIYADSYAEMLDMGDVKMTVTANSAYGENYQYIDCVCNIANETGGADLTIDSVTEYTEAGSDKVISAAITPIDDQFAGQSVNLYATIDQDGEEARINGSFGYDLGDNNTYNAELLCTINTSTGEVHGWIDDHEYGLFKTQVNIDSTSFEVYVTIEGVQNSLSIMQTDTGYKAELWAGDNMINFEIDTNAYALSLDVDTEETSFDLNGTIDPETGVINATLNEHATDSTVNLTAAPAAVEGYDMAYNVAIDMLSGGETVQLTFNAGVATVAYDPAEIAADFANVVILTEEDTEAMSTFEADLTNAFSGILVKLMEIPGVAAIVNSMNGQNPQ